MNFKDKVLEIINKIPKGKVTTYRTVKKSITGTRRHRSK